MPPVAVYDACVLFPATLRDFLLRLAAAELVQPRWSTRILDECFRSIAVKRPDLDPEALLRTRSKICLAFPDAMVADTGGVPVALALPDPDDLHVIATAVDAAATMIVTFNLRDFPESVLRPLGLSAVHPDDFVLGRIDEAPGTACAVVAQQAGALKNPPITPIALVARFRNQGLPRSAARLADLLG